MCGRNVQGQLMCRAVQCTGRACRVKTAAQQAADARPALTDAADAGLLRADPLDHAARLHLADAVLLHVKKGSRRLARGRRELHAPCRGRRSQAAVKLARRRPFFTSVLTHPLTSVMLMRRKPGASSQ